MGFGRKKAVSKDLSNFTDKGLKALIDWSKKNGKIDSSDFTEYRDISEFHKDYMIEDYPTHTHINDRTTLIMIDTGPEDKGFIVKDIIEEKGNFTKREC
jgi:hypothetical protein